jgi:hypothetical protein
MADAGSTAIRPEADVPEIVAGNVQRLRGAVFQPIPDASPSVPEQEDMEFGPARRAQKSAPSWRARAARLGQWTVKNFLPVSLLTVLCEFSAPLRRAVVDVRPQRWVLSTRRLASTWTRRLRNWCPARLAPAATNALRAAQVFIAGIFFISGVTLNSSSMVRRSRARAGER